MEKRMEELIVSTKKGQIWIEQPSMYQEEAPIVINKDQVDLLIRWLEEAKSELEKDDLTK